MNNFNLSYTYIFIKAKYSKVKYFNRKFQNSVQKYVILLKNFEFRTARDKIIENALLCKKK